MTPDSQTADADPPSAPQPLKGLALFLAAFALALCNFIVVLDITIANVSVSHISGGLAVSPSQGLWVLTSYAVAEAITVPLTGWLATRFIERERRPVYGKWREAPSPSGDALDLHLTAIDEDE